MIFDCLIIGGGVSGMQCALVLGSAKNKPFAIDKNIGIIMHQRASHLENALFNNVLGLPPKTLGKDILAEGKEQLSTLYAEIHQIEKEKVISVDEVEGVFKVITNKNVYQSKIVVLALNYSKPFTIRGLETYIIPHKKSNIEKDRIQLRNENHLIKKGLYCCGTIAGHRSQFAIAAGSGASVATDILTLWNHGNHTKVHDKI
ncbi:pyridine nucleotide-disulfide oxidoreductase [Polaribacter vadi]|uniref:Pyridine nucleotide-disulfide oxidoreductase n=1 Tax=Polaribacter vadi TaxID=1774273 RepID=A0A1B8TT10_9FLAO|nr:FAD-dependent oxidoreductase [Polaribacter vadi]AOW18069.1 pyridine nucleotide-disulfide oxidoreductase [Polaribacter vadi]OBY62797.1 pyridine nucleotide-disulfide oxidoreductase [Polaribacter vadi]